MTLLWPLHGLPPKLPPYGSDGAFMARRKHEIHTGADLYCDEDQPVVTVDDGRYVAKVAFTGPEAGSPWWESTQAIIIDHGWGVVVYGELGWRGPTRQGEPYSLVVLGQLAQRCSTIRAGSLVGHVRRVRKPKPDDHRPLTMLHFELWDSVKAVLTRYEGERANEPADWPLEGPRPTGLEDPTELLERIAKAGRDEIPAVRSGHDEIVLVARWDGRFCGRNGTCCDFHGSNNEGQVCCRFGRMESAIGPGDMISDPIPLELENGKDALRCKPCIEEYGE